MRVLVNLSKAEQQYQGHFLSIFGQHGYVGKATYKTYELGDLISLAKKIKAQAIYVTNTLTLKNIVNDPRPNLSEWRGSVLQTSVPIVVGDKLSSLSSSPTGKLFLDIDLAKLRSAVYSTLYKYDYKIADSAQDLQIAEERMLSTAMLVCDIETNFHNYITSISFTEITESIEVGETWVISLLPSHYSGDRASAVLAWATVKSILESSIPKVWHNGCFDCFQLLRHHIAVNNYIYDTEYIWRAWYAELQKGLARVASYILPDFYQWKHESSISPLEYNAKDTINTARIFIQLLNHAPDWVWVNYRQLFPNIGPVLYTAFEGVLVDQEKREEAKKKAQAELDTIQKELENILGLPGFNAGSPKQVSTLLYKVLGAKKPGRAKSESATAELDLQKVARQHPLYAGICSRITKIKELRKAISTYYNARLTSNSRLLYSFALDGTETARMACNASSLYAPPLPGKNWVKSNMKNYGTQLQNIPYYLKKSIKADPGYLLGNIDKSQSEARCTAYLAECPALVEALENPPSTAGVEDFYCYTGYKFFGKEFNKEDPLRQIVKKIIHGTNYMMGAMTFIDSVGVEALQKYKAMVGYKGTLKNFASYLLSLYFKYYPEVEQGWDKIEEEVALTGKLVTPDGWTRKVFGNIRRSHTVKRSLVAHKSQHFSVVGINEAFWRLFYEVQVGSGGEYRLKGQIHDSIFYQAKTEKFDYYEKETLRVMDIPQPTEYGILRIPLDTERGEYWK